MADEEFASIKDGDEIDTMKIPQEVPILTLRDTVIYPFMVSPLFIARTKSIKLIDVVLLGNKILGLVAQKQAEIEEPRPEDLYEYGTVAIVLKMLKFPDGSIRVLVQGLARMKVLKFTQEEPFFKAKIRTLEDVVEKSTELEALARNISNQFQRVVSLVPQLPEELQIAVMNISHPGKLADLVASNLNLSLAEKQVILETLDVKARLEKLTIYLSRELEVLEMGSKIQSQVQTELSKSQREYFLRQQLKAIQKELGEGDERTMEINELREKIEAAKMPEQAHKEAMRELDRLAKMPPGAAEYTVARTYLDWLVSLPWSVTTKDNLDIIQARRVLDEDHYNLEKVDEYIVVSPAYPEMYGRVIAKKRELEGQIKSGLASAA
ncbi:MAG: LON peptidase substrate-binding domain-containing protein, partial [Candidatus Zixiibacteriota bacterium]